MVTFATPPEDEQRGTRTSYVSSHLYGNSPEEACQQCCQEVNEWCIQCRRCSTCNTGIFCKGGPYRHLYIPLEEEGELIPCTNCCQDVGDLCNRCHRCRTCNLGMVCRRNKRLLEERMDHAVWIAFRSGDCDSAIGLVENAGVNPNYQRGCRSTLMMAAAFWGKTKVIQKLLDLGADTTLQGISGRTASCFAKEQGHADIVAMLMERQA